MDIFKDKQVRAIWDEKYQKWWFYAADICAVLTGYSPKKASGYWYSSKHKLKKSRNELLANREKLQMKCADGKLRFTEVLDTKQVLYLITIIPHKAAEPYRLWLAEAAMTGIAQEQLAELGKRNSTATMEEIKREGEPIQRRSVTVTPLE